MTPAEANELELWEIAAVLGVDPGDSDIGNLDDRLQVEATPEQMARRIAKAHVKPRRSKADPPNSDMPVPERKLPDTDLTVQVMRQMGIRPG